MCFGMADAAPYVVSKSAIIGGTKAFALEGAEYGILVNAVAPVAYSRMAGETIADTAQRGTFKATYQGEANVPMILALAHESNDMTGEIFSLGAFAAGRMVLGFKQGVTEALTMEECLERKQEMLGTGKDVVMPSNIYDYLATRSNFTLDR